MRTVAKGLVFAIAASAPEVGFAGFDGDGIRGFLGDGRIAHCRTAKLNRLRKKAPIDADVGACDERARSRAGEKNGSTGEFAGFAEAIHWGVTEDGGSARRGGSVFLKEQAAILVGRKKAWRDGVYTHAAGGPFAREKLCQAENGSLGGGVGDDAGKRDVRGDAGDVDDAAFFGGEHGRAKNLARQQGAAHEVEIKIGGPICGGDGGEVVVGRDGDFWVIAAGGVHEDSGRAELCDGGVEEIRQALARTGVRFEKDGASAL